MNEHLKQILIAVGVVAMLIMNYILSVFIAKILNIHNMQITRFSAIYSDMTWELFICCVFILIEVIIIDEIYKKHKKEK